MSQSLAPSERVLLYDGLCGFCNKTVQTILQHDRRGAMRFAALLSAYGEAVKSRHPELQGVDSVVLVERLRDDEEGVFPRLVVIDFDVFAVEIAREWIGHVTDNHRNSVASLDVRFDDVEDFAEAIFSHKDDYPRVTTLSLTRARDIVELQKWWNSRRVEDDTNA